MKPFILVVLQCVLCSHQPLISHFTTNDFGTYLETDPEFGRRIVIRANYYVGSGLLADSIAAVAGVDFWNKLSGKFFLKVMNKKMDFTGERYPVHFDLKVFSCKDPEGDWKENEKKGKSDRSRKSGADIRNVFLLKDTFESNLNNCRVTDITKSIGLTCEAYHIRLKRTYQGETHVVAHEIGHTLGLDHAELDGLMQEFDRKGTAVFEFEIRKILAYSYQHRLNWFRNNFEKRIPSGIVQDAMGNLPVHSDSCILFVNAEFEKASD